MAPSPSSWRRSLARANSSSADTCIRAPTPDPDHERRPSSEQTHQAEPSGERSTVAQGLKPILSDYLKASQSREPVFDEVEYAIQPHDRESAFDRRTEATKDQLVRRILQHLPQFQESGKGWGAHDGDIRKVDDHVAVPFSRTISATVFNSALSSSLWDRFTMMTSSDQL